MTRHSRTAVSIVIAGVTMMSLVGVGLAGGAQASPAARVAPTPHLAAKISKSQLTLGGPRTFRAGRVAISLKAVGGEREMQVVSFTRGYSMAKLRADLSAFGRSEGPMGASKAGLRHLRNAVRHTHLWGGLDAPAGHTTRGTVVLPHAGTYFVYNDSNAVPSMAKKLTVRGPVAHRAKPNSHKTVIATNAKRFAGASVLPAHGVITFRNASHNSPHLLGLLHVKKGTTRKQVLQALTGNAPPTFLLPGQAGTDVVGEGVSMTLRLDLPRGQYAELCFFPDLQTGMPHAFMGMIRMVTLR
jgi:hypothetical protein